MFSEERDGDEAQDKRADRYQAVQEDNKAVVMEEVQSFNQVASEMNQKVRDEPMNRLLTNNPHKGKRWNVNEKIDGRSGPVRGEVEASKFSSGAKLVES